MYIQPFHQYLHSYNYMFPSCYLWQVCLCSYHLYGSVWLSLYQVYSYFQVQPGAIPAATSLVQLGNVRWDGDDMILHIGWSAAVAAGLDTVHPNWMDLSYQHLTSQQIGAEVGGLYMLDTFVTV